MLELLPTRAGGVVFSQANVIDDGFLSGHAVDDVYGALGKSRRDGLAASRLDPGTGDAIGAMTVAGIPGQDLLDTFVRHWQAEAIVSREAEVIGDRDAWVMEHRGGATTVAYRRNDVVFYAYSEADGRARNYVSDMR